MDLQEYAVSGHLVLPYHDNINKEIVNFDKEDLSV